ncbi:MAG: alpha/beta hydrolase, partial [Chlorobiales bacterium]|nr:alpha/beta hydrolase [Chlorobiales bacterium]
TRAPRDGDVADAEATARRNLGILMFADEGNIDDLAVHIHMQNIPRARVKSRRMALSDTLLRVLPDVAAPLNGIWGEHDTTLPPDVAERENQLRTIQPGLDFRVIEGAGHWVMYEAADAFNATLLDVLSGRREGTA